MGTQGTEPPNLLAYGDNLDVLKRHVASESVDLVYLDPPFNSNADYNVLFHEHGTRAAAQIKAFEDTWTWDTRAAKAYEEVVEGGGTLATTIRAFRTMLGTSDMLAYLAMMAPRLAELKRVLRPGGGLYLHCDPTASHYLKLLLDAVFGPEQFRNEIVWQRTRAHNDRRLRRFGSSHDLLLFYTRGDGWTFNRLVSKRDPSSPRTHDLIRHTDGRLYRKGDCRAPGGRGPSYEWNGHVQNWRFTEEVARQLEAEGKIVYSKTGMPRVLRPVDPSQGSPLQDVWTDIDRPNSGSREALPYPTQKPMALLRRIIEASSNPGDTILDPFCGCGTAIEAAHELGRQWIGIDVTHLATGLIKHRLAERYGPGVAATYRVVGEPTTVDDAAELARDDPFQFQAWALGLVGARHAASSKAGGDRGIDGRLYFHDVTGGPSKQIVISVKAGHLVPAFVRDLVGVIGREEAEIGVLISFEEPTGGIRTEAASAGFYEAHDGRHPRIQLRTVAELLAGHGIDYPSPVDAPTTLWPPESIPTVARVRRRRAAPARPTARPTPELVPVDTEKAVEVRETYSKAIEKRVDEKPAKVAETRSPYPSKRER